MGPAGVAEVEVAAAGAEVVAEVVGPAAVEGDATASKLATATGETVA